MEGARGPPDQVAYKSIHGTPRERGIRRNRSIDGYSSTYCCYHNGMAFMGLQHGVDNMKLIHWQTRGRSGKESKQCLLSFYVTRANTLPLWIPKTDGVF